MTIPQHISTALPYEQRPAACPKCGGPSFERRFAPPAGLSEATRKHLDPERAFVAFACDKCLTRDEEERARVLRDRRRAEALAQLEVPAMYASASFGSFELHGDSTARATLAEALRFAQEYVASWPDVPMISVFAGGFGTGKGHLAWSIVRELAATSAVVSRVAVLSDLIRDLRESWNSNDDGPSESARLRKYRGHELLVIDEVSRHAFYGQPQQHLYDLIAYREQRYFPTLLTTNERGVELSEVLGPALSSRAAGWNGFIDFGDADWRLSHRLKRTA